MTLPEAYLPDRFLPQNSLGRGSFGQTWLATDQQTGQTCVVKQLAIQQADSWKTLELFEREARVLAQLDHPRIPRFLGFFPQPEGSSQPACLVQTYLAGQTLAQVLAAGRRFTEAEVVQMADELLEILEYLQGFSPAIVHRDIKPRNIVLSPERGACLIDFGAVNDTLLHAEAGGGTVVGTFGYMPPEQLDGRAVPASDLYSLGVTLIHALSGLEPALLERENLRLNFRPFCNLSEGLARWLEQMIAPDLRQRFQTAQQARYALRYREHLPPDSLAARPRQSLSWRYPLLALALFTALGGVGWLYQSRSPAPLQGEIQLPAALAQSLPASAPRFWLVELPSRRRISAPTSYQQGRFRISGLAPGRYGLNLAFDTDPANPLQYPGDLRSWAEFEIRAGQRPPQLQMPLLELLHLLAPVDNNQPLPGWGQVCTGAQALSGPQTFVWEPPAPGLHYQYQVRLRRCAASAQSDQVLAQGRTVQTQVLLRLPPTPTGYQACFSLRAYAGNQLVGRLRTHGSTDHDWDFCFRIQS